MPTYKVLGFIEHENKPYSPGDVVEIPTELAHYHGDNLVREVADAELVRHHLSDREKDDSLAITAPNPEPVRENSFSLTVITPDVESFKREERSKKKMIENLDLFFTDFFSVEATLETGTTIRVIFDEEHDALSLGAEGRQMIATAKTSDVIGLHHGDSLIINSSIYQIVGIRPIIDGKITELDLSL